MRFQFVEGVEVPFEFLFGKQGVKLIVAGAANENDGVPFVIRRFLFGLLVFVPSHGDQMMPGYGNPFSFAQYTVSGHLNFGFGLAKYVSCIDGG